MTRPEKKKQAKRNQRAQRVKQEKYQRRQLRVQRAQTDPKPAPTARSYFVQKIWDKLGLDQALAQVGISKEGLPYSAIFIIVLLMGIMGAASLHQLVGLVPQDAALLVMLALHNLEEKQLYRGLAQVTVAEYQAWMGELLKRLQRDPRTLSLKEGVVLGDTTQIVKREAHKIPGVQILFVHSEKIFAKGVEIVNTHYADDHKDYPLFMEFYQPDETVLAERAAQRARRQAGVDGRKPAAVLAYLTEQVNQGNRPEVVTLSGPHLSQTLTNGLEKLDLPWLGVSDQRRSYTLPGRRATQKAKTLLSKANPARWTEEADLGYRFAVLGEAASSLGQVLLVMAEHMADEGRTLYLTAASISPAEAMTRITLVLEREQARQETGLLGLMLKLLTLSRQAHIRAENAAFDRWFFIPWFIQAVLHLGFKRVVIKAKAGFTYTYHGQTYDLPDLWSVLDPQAFKPQAYHGQTYWLAALLVDLKDVGRVKLVFVRQPMRRRQGMLQSVLMCTDPDYPDQKVLRVYLLRWRIEVCYREVKQNHAFGQFHAQTMETNYGQTMLSLVAYLFQMMLKLTVPPLAQQTMGWIKTHYLNAIVSLVVSGDPANPDYVIEFPGWLIDDYGLPIWQPLSLPILAVPILC